MHVECLSLEFVRNDLETKIPDLSDWKYDKEYFDYLCLPDKNKLELDIQWAEEREEFINKMAKAIVAQHVTAILKHIENMMLKDFGVKTFQMTFFGVQQYWLAFTLGNERKNNE